MAQITWRNVDTPQLSTRDIALAGEQVTAGFDRFAQALATREANLRTKATDAAIGARLAIQDPTQLGQVDPASLDPRVNMRALLEADNQHRNALIQRAQQNEQLLNSQAMAQFASEGIPLLLAARNGNKEAIAAVQGRSANDPGFARWVGNMSDEVLSAWQGGETFRQTQKRDADDLAIKQQQLGIQRNESALRIRALQQAENDRAAIEAGQNFARAAITSDTSGASFDDFSQRFKESEEFKRLSLPGQAAALDLLKNPDLGRDAYATPTSADRERSIAPLYMTVNEAITELDAVGRQAGVRAEQARAAFYAKEPVAQTLNYIDSLNAAAAKDPSTAPTAQTVAALAESMDVDMGELETIRREKGLTYTDITALLNDGSVRDTAWSPFSGAENALRIRADELYRARTEGGALAGIRDREQTVVGQYLNTQAEVKEVNDQLLRYAAREIDPPKEVLDKYEALTAQLLRAAEKVEETAAPAPRNRTPPQLRNPVTGQPAQAVRLNEAQPATITPAPPKSFDLDDTLAPLSEQLREWKRNRREENGSR